MYLGLNARAFHLWTQETACNCGAVGTLIGTLLGILIGTLIGTLVGIAKYLGQNARAFEARHCRSRVVVASSSP